MSFNFPPQVTTGSSLDAELTGFSSPQVEDAPTPLTTATAESLKASIVSILISLASEPALQVQIREAISVMAEADFPEQWKDLVNVSLTLGSVPVRGAAS